MQLIDITDRVRHLIAEKSQRDSATQSRRHRLGCMTAHGRAWRRIVEWLRRVQQELESHAEVRPGADVPTEEAPYRDIGRLSWKKMRCSVLGGWLGSEMVYVMAECAEKGAHGPCDCTSGSLSLIEFDLDGAVAVRIAKAETRPIRCARTLGALQHAVPRKKLMGGGPRLPTRRSRSGS